VADAVRQTHNKVKRLCRATLLLNKVACLTPRVSFPNFCQVEQLNGWTETISIIR